jgi:signal transduction histidine kinase
VLFAYGEDLRSQNPAAPEISAELSRGIAQRDVASAAARWPTSAVEILVRTPWRTGPCAFVLARGTTDPAWGGVLPKRPFWLLPAAVAFAAMLLATGSVVRRIRRLTESVRRSAESAYSGSIGIGGSDEVAELGRAFEAAGAEIRAQLRDRDQREQALRDFVANTTHDVMVPLTVLQGHLSTLRERAALAKREEDTSTAADPLAKREEDTSTAADPPAKKEEGSATDVETLVSAMNEAHYMASLVHNLAAAARLASPEGKLQPSDVDLGALVQRVAGRHRPIARQLDVSLESAIPEEPLVVRADMTLLEQAVSNVVYNAVRHNRPGGHVAVILEPDEQAIFSLHVIDDGPGIAPEELSRIAQRGYRGDAARTRAPDGQGLGLHIAFRAIELHGYSMKLRASEHGGLEVLFTGRAERATGS